MADLLSDHIPDVPLPHARGSQDVIVRYLRDGDATAVLDLLQTAFGRWPRTNVSAGPLEHLRWKLRLEVAGERRHRIAELDGKRVGFIGGWTRPALLKGKPITIADGSDICVHPDFQGRGVMGALISSGELGRRTDACYLEGSSHPAVIGKRSEVAETLGVFGNRVERFVRPMTLRAAIDAFRLRPGRTPRKLASSAARFAGCLASRAREREQSSSHPSVREVTAFDERADALWHEASRPFEFVMTRDLAYLSWRYDRLGGEYTILIAEEDARLLGYTVVCRDREGEHGFVADLLVLPERLDAASALPRAGLARLRRAGVEDVECWLPERHPYRAPLEQAGFILRRRKDATAYRAAGGVPEEDLAFLREPDARIHFTLGDIDRV